MPGVGRVTLTPRADRLYEYGGEAWIKVKQPEYRVKERGFYDPERT